MILAEMRKYQPFLHIYIRYPRRFGFAANLLIKGWLLLSLPTFIFKFILSLHRLGSFYPRHTLNPPPHWLSQQKERLLLLALGTLQFQ